MSHDASRLPPLSGGTFVSTWQFHAGWTVVGLALLAAYLTCALLGRRNGAHLARSRMFCFVAGVMLLVITISSAINAYALSMFWMHMVEHLTLIMVVPALLVLGHPLSVLREAGPAELRPRADAICTSWLVAVVTHPIFGLMVYGATIFVTHLTSFMDQMMVHPWLMTGEQVLYLVAGYVMLLPLIGEEPIRWRLPYLLRIVLLMVAMLPDTIVGIVLMQTDHDLFPMMERGHPAWALAPVRDLQTGGALMWAGGDGLMMCIALDLVLTLVTGSTRERLLGPWLESVRRETLAGHLDLVDNGTPIDGATRIDDDDDVLEAYNRMLAGLHDPNQDSHRHV